MFYAGVKLGFVSLCRKRVCGYRVLRKLMDPKERK
jgi:hypothetical protein